MWISVAAESNHLDHMGMVQFREEIDLSLELREGFLVFAVNQRLGHQD